MPTPVRRAFRAFRFLFERTPWVFEVIFGLGTAAFFFLLWADWRDGPMFGSILLLSEIRSEDFWKWFGICGGLAQFAGAAFGRPGRPLLKWMRWLVAGLLAYLWGAMACAAWFSSPWSPTVAMYVATSAANLYVALHVLWEDEFRLRRRLGG